MLVPTPWLIDEFFVRRLWSLLMALQRLNRLNQFVMGRFFGSINSSEIWDKLNFPRASRFRTSFEHLDFELSENIQILDVLMKLGFWPLKWLWRSIMTLISVVIVPYVSLFSVICIVVLATPGNFVTTWNYTFVAAGKNANLQRFARVHNLQSSIYLLTSHLTWLCIILANKVKINANDPVSYNPFF